MADNVELEEAEACSDDGGGSFVDLDVALAYIGEKLQHVLGHHQKDFDGGVSAENLGRKFGGYGSFLHTYQRSPTPSPQTRSPTKVANISTSRSPYQQSAEDLSQLFIRLTAVEDNEVHECLDGRGSSSEVLVLHESSNIEVTREKFQCLRPHGWLNDEVINLYLELLKERGIREPKRFLKCHFFNTFFYKKLACGKSGYDYKSVKRWTTCRKLGYELIECDKIFVPVHKDAHWCLAIINMKKRTLQYLDSLGGNDRHVQRVLANYIVEEVKDKSNKEIGISSWKEESDDYIPSQENGWDCGMFMLKYIDFHSRGLSLSFSQEHMEYFQKRTAKEILRLRAD